MKYLGRDWTNADIDGLRAVVVPSGIGEFQWSWTKFLNTGERFAILGLDGAPRRLHEFCALHPQIAAFGYASYDYSTIRMFQKEHKLTTWQAVTDLFSPGALVMLACNPHLEAGLPLADWLPDLPTTYRYPLATTDAHRARAVSMLANREADDILIGISCASYRGADAWKTWKVAEWLDCLTRVQQAEPRARFVLLGGAWDDLTASVYDEDSQLRWLVDTRGFPPVGRTNFGDAVEILSRCHGYIGFSSGLGHVALHCCGTPVFMLWPDHEQPLSRSWVDPTALDDGSYVPSRWNAPEEVFRLMKPWLRRLSARPMPRPCVALGA